MDKPTLPKTPVDGFTIVWYQVFKHVSTATVSKHRAVYYMNTKWSDHYPERSGGVDLVDNWMYYQDNSASGRSVGWESILQSDWSGDYDTHNKAVEAAIAYCKDRIEYAKKEIGWSEECIRKFATQLMMMGKEPK